MRLLPVPHKWIEVVYRDGKAIGWACGENPSLLKAHVYQDDGGVVPEAGVCYYKVVKGDGDAEKT